MSTESDRLFARVDRLERAMRRWRWTAFGAMGVGIVAIVGGATMVPPDALTAKRFDCVDEAGRVRATLGANEGGAFLILNDVQGRVRSQLVLQNDGTTGLNFKDAKSIDRVSLAFQADENSFLVFRSPDKRHVQQIGGRSDGDMIGNRVAALESATGRTGPTAHDLGPVLPGGPRTPDRQADADRQQRLNQVQMNIKSVTDQLGDAQRLIDAARKRGESPRSADQAKVERLRLELDRLRVEADSLR